MKKITVYIDTKDSGEFHSDEFKDYFTPNWECGNEIHSLCWGKLKFGNVEIDILARSDLPELPF